VDGKKGKSNIKFAANLREKGKKGKGKQTALFREKKTEMSIFLPSGFRRQRGKEGKGGKRR